MIVILCDSYYDAIDSFHQFLDGIIHYLPHCEVTRVFENALCLETDEDLRYIFVDYRYGDKFRHMNADFIGVYQFFDFFNEGLSLY